MSETREHILQSGQAKTQLKPDMDRRLGLSAGRHRQEKARTARLALHFTASPLGDSVRENAHFTGSSAKGLHNFRSNYRQPTDSVRLLTGQ